MILLISSSIARLFRRSSDISQKKSQREKREVSIRRYFHGDIHKDLIPKTLEVARLRQVTEALCIDELSDWGERASPTPTQLQR